MFGMQDRWRRGRFGALPAPEDRVRGADGTPADGTGTDGLCLDPYDTLGHAAAKAPRAYSWSRAGIAEPAQWQEMARIKLAEVSGYGRFGGPPQMLYRKDLGDVDGLHHETLYVRARHAYDVPVRLVYRDGDGSPRAPVICLQGDGIGMQASWASATSDAERAAVAAGFDFAVQAARRGHIAVCIELMGAGERRPAASGPEMDSALRGIATHGMLLGHSLLGQHASDITVVANWLLGLEVGLPVCADRIAVVGHDLGAAAALLAAALDIRIAAVAMVDPPPRFRDAVKQRAVTPEMTMPGLLRWMDIDDIVLLCAPRPLLACAGRAPSAAAGVALEDARIFYELFDAGAALTTSADMAGLWEGLDRALAGIAGAGDPTP